LIAGFVLAALVLAILLFLLLFDWDWLRGPIGRYASARTGREVRIEGHLRVHPWSWTPSAQVQGLRIGNPAWLASGAAGPGQFAYVRQFDVSVRLGPLFIGRVELPLVRLEQPQVDLVRDAQDRANWRFDSSTSSKPAKLPPIQSFFIRDGRLTMKDARRNLTLSGTVNAAEQDDGTGRGFQLVGQGTMNKDAFKLEATGGPLIHVEASKPYPFHLDLTAGPTHVVADGALPKPFNLGQAQAEVTATGRNLADLYPLTGLALPATPPYSLKTHLERQDSKFTLTGISGRVGESDLEGSMTLDKPNDRRTVAADLTSRKLVFADLLAVIGGGPKAAAAKASAAAPAPTPPGRLLPDASLYRDRLRTMDAILKYRAQAVETGKWPLKRFALDLTLDDGLLVMNPIDFEFPQGKLTGRIQIDGRKPVAVTDLDMRLTNLGLQQFLPAKKGEPPAIEGAMEARAQLHGVGDTIHKAASTATGRVVLVVPHGKIRQSFAELLGINVANGLYLLLSKDNRETDLRCAVADFKVGGGQMQVANAVFDTGVVRAQGKGSADLANETLDLRLDGKPKKPRFLRLWAPITLKGTFLHPKPGVDAGRVAGQLGIGVAVGAVLAPLAAVLPFIEPGLAKDADCVALIQEAKAEGAPVKAAPAVGPVR
jgi:AsmA family protein